MSFYEKYCLPHFLNCACGLKAVQLQRERVVPQAAGQVLEIGMGSGLNLPYYDTGKVDFVWGLEPSLHMRKKAGAAVVRANVEVRWLDLPSEAIPLPDDSVDTVLLTYTLCTIPDWLTGLRQMRRVLKPGGKLIFCEHGEAPDKRVRKWQARLNPLWQRIAGGCQLDRPIPRFIEAGGFTIETVNADYIPGPRVAGYNYWGTAVQPRFVHPLNR